MKPRPILAGFLALLVLQTAPAANITPVLSAIGAILWPGTTPAASITGSSGALTIAAGGTNQNVTVTPSGTGYTILNGKVGAGVTTPARRIVAEDSAQVVAAFSSTSGVQSLVRIYNSADGETGALGLGALAGGTGGSVQHAGYIDLSPGSSTKIRYFSTGGAQLGGTTDPGAGVFDAVNGYKKNGTAGISSTITIRNSLGTGTCTVTFSGGIVTGSTC